MVNALLELADEVHGYQGLTFHKDSLRAGKQEKWTSPVGPNHGGPDSGANYKGKRKPLVSSVGSSGPTSTRLQGGGYAPTRWQ
jgi:hypothetical protein